MDNEHKPILHDFGILVLGDVLCISEQVSGCWFNRAFVSEVYDCNGTHLGNAVYADRVLS